MRGVAFERRAHDVDGKAGARSLRRAACRDRAAASAPSLSSSRRWPASAETCAATAWARPAACSRASGAAAAVQTKPSSSSGMPCLRAASVAPKIAASSRPPTRGERRQRIGKRRAMMLERRHRRRPPCAPARHRRRRCRGRPSRRRRRRTALRRSPPRPWCCRCPSRRGRAGRHPRRPRHSRSTRRRGNRLPSSPARCVKSAVGRSISSGTTVKFGAGDARELVDGGAAGREVADHLRRHFGRERPRRPAR